MESKLTWQVIIAIFTLALFFFAGQSLNTNNSEQELEKLNNSISLLESKIDNLSTKLDTSIRDKNKVNALSNVANLSPNRLQDIDEVIQYTVEEALQREADAREVLTETIQLQKVEENKEKVESIITLLETATDTVTRKSLAQDINSLPAESRHLVFNKIGEMLNKGELDPKYFFKGYAVQ